MELAAKGDEADELSGEGRPEVKAATVAQVAVEGGNNGAEGALALPVAETAVADLPGGEIGGQIVPGAGGADLPEDGIQDTALVVGWAAARGGQGRGEQGLDESPLFIGQGHGGFEEKNLIKKTKEGQFRGRGFRCKAPGKRLAPIEEEEKERSFTRPL